MDFRWNDWNAEHVSTHGISPAEAESVVRWARKPFPRKLGDEKWLVWGRGQGGRCIQVIFVLDEDQTIFVIHARLLTEAEKRRLRRSGRS